MADVHKLRSTPVYNSALSHLQHTVANATSTQELEKAISRLHAVVRLAAADASEKWNARMDRLWRKLPPELRAECFGYLPMRDIAALSLTSRKWHAYCVGTPSLWADVSYPWPFLQTLRQLRAALRLSAACPLDVKLTASSVASSKVLDALLPHAHRLRSLTIMMVTGGYADVTFLLNRLLREGPLPRLRRLDLCKSTTWQNIPSDLWRLCPGLQCLVVHRTPLPDISLPTPELQHLTCVLHRSSQSQHIFDLCPNIQTLKITETDHHRDLLRPTLLPQGGPPASLRHFSLQGQFSEPLGYFEPWFGHRQLHHLYVDIPRLALDPIVALFASVCTGPWTMSISSHYDTKFNALLQAQSSPRTRFEVCFRTNTDTGTGILSGCSDHLSALVALKVSQSVLGLLGVSGTVTLPALTRLEISEERSVPTYKLSPGSAGVIRAPCLRAIAVRVGMLYNCPDDRQTCKFLLAVRSLVEFDSPQLDQISFNMRKGRLDEVDKDGDLVRRLHELATRVIFID